MVCQRSWAFVDYPFDGVLRGGGVSETTRLQRQSKKDCDQNGVWNHKVSGNSMFNPFCYDPAVDKRSEHNRPDPLYHILYIISNVYIHMYAIYVSYMIISIMKNRVVNSGEAQIVKGAWQPCRTPPTTVCTAQTDSCLQPLVEAAQVWADVQRGFSFWSLGSFGFHAGLFTARVELSSSS